MIAALRICGFIPSTVDCAQCNETSTEGAAGTIDATCFEQWVEYCMCPVLGNHAKDDPRSIVVMENASTRMDGRAATLIRSQGAYSLHVAPCSPGLNQIGCAFNVHESPLKRNERSFQFDWCRTHL